MNEQINLSRRDLATTKQAEPRSKAVHCPGQLMTTTMKNGCEEEEESGWLLHEHLLQARPYTALPMQVFT